MSKTQQGNKGGFSAGATIGMLAGAILCLLMLLGEFVLQLPQWMQITAKILLGIVGIGLLIRFAISSVAKD